MSPECTWRLALLIPVVAGLNVPVASGKGFPTARPEVFMGQLHPAGDLNLSPVSQVLANRAIQD